MKTKSDVQEIVKLNVVGEGPGKKRIIYKVTKQTDGSFEHILGCPQLISGVRILGHEKEKNLPIKQLEKDLSLFKAILETKMAGVK